MKERLLTWRHIVRDVAADAAGVAGLARNSEATMPRTVLKQVLLAVASALLACLVIAVAAETSEWAVLTICGACTDRAAYALIAAVWAVGSIAGGACGGAVGPRRSMAGAWIVVFVLTLVTCFAMLMQASEGFGTHGMRRSLTEGMSCIFLFLLAYWLVQRHREVSSTRLAG